MAWIVTIASPSTIRVEALGKYLVKFVTSSVFKTTTTYSETIDPRRARPFEATVSQDSWYDVSDNQSQQDTERFESRLVVLHIIDAVFCTLQKHAKVLRASPQTFATDIKPSLIEILHIVPPKQGKYSLDAHKIIRSLLASWKDAAIYDHAVYLKFRVPARSAYKAWLEWLSSAHPSHYQKLHKRVEAAAEPPRYHGSHQEPWHRQPAATMIPLITGSRPISTARMKPLRLSSDLDPELLSAVLAHIENGHKIYNSPKTSPFAGNEDDIQLNGLGLRVTLDPVTGKRKALETYYGHSPKFVEEMKRRRKNPAPPVLAASDSIRAPPPVYIRETPTPPPPASSQFNTSRPPPPPSSGPGSYVPPPPPTIMNMGMNFPGGFPPRPPNWNGPWPPPPPPPPHAAGMVVPPPWMPPMGPGGGAQHGQGRGGRGGRGGWGGGSRW